MLTLNQTTGNNSASIWLLKLNTPTPIYISTRDITLDSTVYDGKALNLQSNLTDITQDSSVSYGGGTGTVSSFSFSVSRYVDNTNLNSFFNEFYPATSGINLTSVIVQLGIVWEGATTEAEITWLFTGRIIDYGYDQRKLNITVFQESEITNKEVPFYSVQKDFNNSVSYFPYAEKEIYGDTIPIIYGDFRTWNPVPRHIDTVAYGSENYANFILAPVIITNKATLEMVVCSHKVHTTNYNPSTYFGAALNNTFKYLNGLDTYMHIYESSADVLSNQNYVNGFKYLMQYEKTKMYGRLSIHLNQVSDFSSSAGIDSVIDDNPNTYNEIDSFSTTATNKIALVTNGSENTSEIGYLGQTTGNIVGRFAIVSDDGGSRNYRIGIRNASDSTALYSETATSSISGTTVQEKTIDISGDVTAKSDADLPYTIEELCSYDWYIINFSASDKIRVYYAYIHITDINVLGQIFKNKGFGSIKTPNIRGVNIKFRIPGLHT